MKFLYITILFLVLAGCSDSPGQDEYFDLPASTTLIRYTTCSDMAGDLPQVLFIVDGLPYYIVEQQRDKVQLGLLSPGIYKSKDWRPCRYQVNEDFTITEL